MPRIWKIYSSISEDENILAKQLTQLSATTASLLKLTSPNTVLHEACIKISNKGYQVSPSHSIGQLNDLILFHNMGCQFYEGFLFLLYFGIAVEWILSLFIWTSFDPSIYFLNYTAVLSYILHLHTILFSPRTL